MNSNLKIIIYCDEEIYQQIYNKYMKFFRITGYGYNYTIGWHLLKIIE